MTAAASDSTLTSALGANRFHRNPCLDQEGLNAFGSVLAEGLIGFLSSYSISVPDQTHRRGRILEQERHDRIRRGRQRLAIDRGNVRLAGFKTVNSDRAAERGSQQVGRRSSREVQPGATVQKTTRQIPGGLIGIRIRGALDRRLSAGLLHYVSQLMSQ